MYYYPRQPFAHDSRRPRQRSGHSCFGKDIPRGMWRRLCHDDGIALIVALMAMMLLLPLGAALTLITTTETRIGGNYHDGVDTVRASAQAPERVAATSKS